MQGRESPPELRGIIPNSFDHIFEAVKITTHKEFLIRCAYLEIYNEEVRDLLGDDPLKRLELKEDPSQGVFVKDLVFVEVRVTTGVFLPCLCVRVGLAAWPNRRSVAR